MNEGKPKVLIAIPTKGEIKTKTVDNLFSAIGKAASQGIECKLVFAEGTVVPMVRTVLVKEYLKYPQFTHMLWIDSDQTFANDFIIKLLENDKDVCVAISKVRSNENYNIYKYDQASELYAPIIVEKDMGLLKIDAAGMGMMLVKRKVLECVQKIEINGDKSEDIYFCERVRNLNFEIWADCKLILGHLVTTELR